MTMQFAVHKYTLHLRNGQQQTNYQQQTTKNYEKNAYEQQQKQQQQQQAAKTPQAPAAPRKNIYEKYKGPVKIYRVPRPGLGKFFKKSSPPLLVEKSLRPPYFSKKSLRPLFLVEKSLRSLARWVSKQGWAENALHSTCATRLHILQYIVVYEAV